MARRFKSKRELGAMSDINVTPLLDLAFALLIIFVITTPLLEQPIAVQLPNLVQSEEIVRQASNEPIQITIDESGSFFVGEIPIEDDALGQVLGSYNSDRVFVVRGDRSVTYDRVATVLDVLRNLGLTQVVVSYTGS